MSHFSDVYHLDTCAGTHCRGLWTRTEMKRIPGKRGWFCPHCQARYARSARTQGVLDLGGEKG